MFKVSSLLRKWAYLDKSSPIMNGRWEKLGLIFCPNQNYPWMNSHAQNPVVENLGGSHYRVYFSCRDKDYHSSVAFFEFDINRPKEILKVADRPLLMPGERGAFDDSGVSIGCMLLVNGKRYLYYLGWHLGVTVPFCNTIGLAIDDNFDLNFERVSQAPIVDRNHVDHLSLSYPWVMKEGDLWRMWYGSHLRWGKNHGDMDHIFKYAESKDGIHWNRDGKVILSANFPQECALSRPMVLKEGGIYKMWFSYRDTTYRIGYAESPDGRNWTRDDQKAGLTVSDSGWDSESVEYPCVFNHEGKKFLLYNGNNYGKTGMGLAVWKD